MKLTEKTLKETYIFKGKIINLRVDDVELPDGNTATREIIEHNGGVCVLPLTDEDEIVFVRQFRYPYKEELLEIPAGKRDSKEEIPLECGIRELREETGAVAKEFISLGELYPSPGYVGEVIYMYLAKGLTLGEDDRDEDEFLNVEKVPFAKALEMVMNGELKDAKTQTAILKAALILGRV